MSGSINHDGHHHLMPSTSWGVKCLFLFACTQIQHGTYSLNKSCCSAHHNIWSNLTLTQHGSVGELGFAHLLPQLYWCVIFGHSTCWLIVIELKIPTCIWMVFKFYNDVAKPEHHDVSHPVHSWLWWLKSLNLVFMYVKLIQILIA